MFTRFKTLPRYNHARLTKTLINPLISPHRVVFVRFTRRRTLFHAFTHILDAFQRILRFSILQRTFLKHPKMTPYKYQKSPTLLHSFGKWNFFRTFFAITRAQIIGMTWNFAGVRFRTRRNFLDRSQVPAVKFFFSKFSKKKVPVTRKKNFKYE